MQKQTSLFSFILKTLSLFLHCSFFSFTLSTYIILLKKIKVTQTYVKHGRSKFPSESDLKFQSIYQWLFQLVYCKGQRLSKIRTEKNICLREKQVKQKIDRLL